MKQKPPAIKDTPIQDAIDQMRERLAYHYAERAYVIGNEASHFRTLASEIYEASFGSGLDLDETATAFTLLGNLYKNHQLSKEVPAKYRDKISMLLAAMNTMFIRLFEIESDARAIIAEGLDYMGFKGMSATRKNEVFEMMKLAAHSPKVLENVSDNQEAHHRNEFLIKELEGRLESLTQTLSIGHQSSKAA